MGRWWRREEIQESKGTKGPKVQGSHGPSYLKVTFKYELDSKEGLVIYFKFLNGFIFYLYLSFILLAGNSNNVIENLFLEVMSSLELSVMELDVILLQMVRFLSSFQS